MAKSPEQLAHEQWLGYIQPEGLVVSIPALLDARAHINQNFLPRHRALLEFLPKDRDSAHRAGLPSTTPMTFLSTGRLTTKRCCSFLIEPVRLIFFDKVLMKPPRKWWFLTGRKSCRFAG